jgi:hypothetical protein
MIPRTRVESTAHVLMSRASIDIPANYLSGTKAIASEEEEDLSSYMLPAILENYEVANHVRQYRGVTRLSQKRHLGGGLSFVPVGAIYLTTVRVWHRRSAGAGIKKVRAALWLDELPITQAMWVLEVERFGLLLVERVSVKNSLFKAKNQEVNVGLAKLHEGLNAPSLSRYGETNDLAQELI